jgi:RimJ/RimL family protein N-acetyltransferase
MAAMDEEGTVRSELPLGEPVDWAGGDAPSRGPLRGPRVELRPLEPARDAESIYAATHAPGGDPEGWTYLPYGPFEDADALRVKLEEMAGSEDPLFFAVVVGGVAAGFLSYLRITPQFGVIEIGHIHFGAPLRRSTAATEAIYLLARHAFDDLGYRRLEWKCDALNAPSCRAAERFGFRFEGVFRKHQITKGRNRDTAWYAIVDDEWSPLRRAFEAWLAPENFDGEGRQRRPLAELRAEHATV